MFGYIALPVIWRGIAFRFGEYSLRGGRRVAIHEFPTRDDPFTEDLGRDSMRRAADTAARIASRGGSAPPVDIMHFESANY